MGPGRRPKRKFILENGIIARRYLALYLLRKGQKAEAMGEIVGVCRRTIQRWLRGGIGKGG